MAAPPPPAPPAPGAPARPRLAPQAGPAAWQAAELRPADWMLPLGPEDVAELEAALAGLAGRAPASAAEAPLPRLAALLAQAASRLDTGRGFVLLRGLPLDRLGEAQAGPALLALGAHLGRTLPQGPHGEALQRVLSPAREAGGTGGLRWRFHADAADVVALLVLRQPPGMDAAVLVSAMAAHNALLGHDRAALEALHAPLPHLLRRPAGGAPAVAALPVFSAASGAFTGRYARSAIEAAQRLPETPRLTAAQVAALDALDAVCAEPGLALRVELRPGDVLLFNPLLVWKRRAERPAEPEEPPAEPGTAREALRLLLVAPNSRALPQGLVAVGTEPAAGGAGMTGG